MKAANIASHRFGFSEPSLAAVQSDPRGWVMDQLRHPAQLDTNGLMDSVSALLMTREVLKGATKGQAADADKKPQDELGAMTPSRLELRKASIQCLRRRWQHVVSTPTPVAERWVQFWANHFCVAATKGTMIALVWPHENEAIRPNAFGNFKALARAAVLHPAMLLYLDNAQSIGPDSPGGQRRSKGLNENLARELLELHTLGVRGGYSQEDVTQTAKLLTGWTVNARTQGKAAFVNALHQPGAKQVLAKRYAQGPQALDELLGDLVRHPSCADFVATKLVRHFVSDDPPPALVRAVATRFRDTDGDLPGVANALFGNDLAWRTDSVAKLKRPEEYLLSAHRMLRLPSLAVEQLVPAVQGMGQSIGRAPSPQGWPDRAEDWLSPDALLKRVHWAESFAQRYGAGYDARVLARAAFGEDLSSGTSRQIERADSAVQAIALLLASPEFQRR